MILAGDIGGTNTRLALFDVKRDKLIMRDRAETKNAGRDGFAGIVREFLEPLKQRVRVACFGVAGPVKDGRAQLTNLHWSFDERRLARSLKIPRVVLINDLVAHAEGTNVLGPKDVTVLHKGRPEKGGNRAILAPGTGLGEAGIVYDDRTGEYRAVASEGGHCDFSPTNDREIALLEYMLEQTGRCSWEDVLSGPGLRRIWDFLILRHEFHVEPSLESRDPEPSDITAAAMNGSCRACGAAVEMFVALCGAEAGNLALKFLATGGVFIGGGIPPHILKFLRKPSLKHAFRNHGAPEIRQILAAVPIKVITSEHNALFGAAHAVRKL